MSALVSRNKSNELESRKKSRPMDPCERVEPILMEISRVLEESGTVEDIEYTETALQSIVNDIKARRAAVMSKSMLALW